MARKALIRDSDGLVANVIELEDGANWQPPEGHHVRDAVAAGPGDTWDGVKFVAAPISEPPPDPDAEWVKSIEAAKTLAELKLALVKKRGV